MSKCHKLMINLTINFGMIRFLKMKMRRRRRIRNRGIKKIWTLKGNNLRKIRSKEPSSKKKIEKIKGI